MLKKKIFLFVFFNTIKTFFAFRMTLVFYIVINLPEGAWILKWEVAPVGYFQVIIVPFLKTIIWVKIIHVN